MNDAHVVPELAVILDRPAALGAQARLRVRVTHLVLLHRRLEEALVFA